MPYLTVGTSSGTPVELYVEDNRLPETTGTPVVLVHGWLQTTRTFDAQVDALVSAGHRVVTYDRRGFGRSSKPYDGYDFDTFATDLAAICNHLDLRQACLVGTSNGGADVVRYVAADPTRVDRVVLASATPPYVYAAPDNPAGSLTDDAIAYLQGAIRSDRAGFVQHMVADMFTPGGGRALVSQATLDDAFQQAMTASARATAACVAAWNTDFRPDLAEVRLPALIVHGDSDHVLPVETTGLLTHRALSDSRLVTIPGGPHAVHITHPDQFNSALIDFLDR